MYYTLNYVILGIWLSQGQEYILERYELDWTIKKHTHVVELDAAQSGGGNNNNTTGNSERELL